MSRWTHIVGALLIELPYSEETIEKLESSVREDLKSAPSITGSEENTFYFVNVIPAPNSATYDFENDKFVQYYSRAIITLQGNLRDRDKDTVIEETFKFVDYLKDKLNYYIDDYALKILDEIDGEIKIEL